MLINNPAYVDLVQAGEIYVAISPQLITIGSLLRLSVVAISLTFTPCAVVLPKRSRLSPAVIVTAPKLLAAVLTIDLPTGTTIGAIVRGDEVIIAHDQEIEAGDHVILFLTDKKRITEVEKLFQVGIAFF